MKQETWKKITVVLVLMVFAGCSSSGGDSTSPEPVYGAIGTFNGKLAKTKTDGKWGFIDESGDLVIPAEYDSVKHFSEGMAGFEKFGRWGFINRNGQPAFQRSFFDIRPYSEDLAAVMDRAASSFWGYIDKTGETVIAAQFERALPFSEGLAPVFKEGAWRYIRPDGSEAFSTDFYRAYPFTGEGLALIRQEKCGRYGYIEKDGTLRIKAVYDLGLPFSNGLAAVQVGGKWGYIDVDGTYKIQPLYDYAASFSEGLAVVKKNGEYRYITTTGELAFATAFSWAESFSEGRAVVMDNQSYWYIDRSGGPLRIARAYKLSRQPDSSNEDCDTMQGVRNSFQGGFVRFQIVNADGPSGSITTENTIQEGQWTVLPGFPEKLTWSGDKDAQLDKLDFMLHYVSACGNVSSGGDVFDLTFKSTDPKWKDLNFTLSNSTLYKPPDQTNSHPFWKMLKGGIKVLKSAVEYSEGRVLKGLVDCSTGVYDIISGEQGFTDNEIPDDKGTMFETKLFATMDGNTLSSFSGDFCGGDLYTISDGDSVVIQISTARQEYYPAEVDVTLFNYWLFYALKAVQRLDWWRSQGDEFINDEYEDVMKSTFANYNNPDDKVLCENEDGSQGYMQSLADWDSRDLREFWNLANNYGTVCNDPYVESEGTYCEYFAKKLTFQCVGQD